MAGATSPLPGDHGPQVPAGKSQSRDQVESVVRELNKTMESLTHDLEFTVDSTTKETVIRVINTSTHQVVRQIPSEEMLRVAQRIAALLGVLYDQQG